MDVRVVLQHTLISLDELETRSLLAFVQAWLQDRPMLARGQNVEIDLARDLVNQLSH